MPTWRGTIKGQRRSPQMMKPIPVLGAAWNREHGRTGVIAACMALTLGGVLWFAGCDRAGPLREPLVIGTNVWPGYEPLYLARELEFFTGADVKLAEYSSATQVLRAFRNRTIQVAALTLDEVLLLRESGIDVCVILVTDISNGSDVILAASGTDDLAGLRGKRVGVESTALGAYVLARAIQRAEIPSTDITIVSLEIDEHESAVAEKEVDAVVTFEPVRSRLLAQGMTEVFDSSMIPGEIVDVLAVRRETCELRSGQLESLVEGWFKALQHMKEQPESAARHMASRLRLDPDEVLAAYDGLVLPGLEQNIAMLNGPAPSLDETVTRLAKVMSDLKLLDSDTRFERFACSSILMTVGTYDSRGNSARGPSKEM